MEVKEKEGVERAYKEEELEEEEEVEEEENIRYLGHYPI